MAGRARRIPGNPERTALRRPGAPPVASGDVGNDLQILIQKISEINLLENADPVLLGGIQTLFNKQCGSLDSLKDVLTNLHSRALSDHIFGEKLVIALEQIESAPARTEILKLVQNDFSVKEMMAQSDSKKFINSVMLLGWIYKRFRAGDQPIAVLGVALMDYTDLLLKGDEEQLKVLVTQLFLNGSRMSLNDTITQKYELLKHNLRRVLVTTPLNTTGKLWILLALDFMSNNQMPLRGVVRDFYLAQIGEEYLKLENCNENGNDVVNASLDLAKSKTKSVANSTEPAMVSQNSDTSNGASVKQPSGVPEPKKLAEQLGRVNLDLLVGIKTGVDRVREEMKAKGVRLGGNELKVRSAVDKKHRKWQEGEKLSDDEKIWGLNDRSKLAFQHDDRFEKDDDWYGIQMPRGTKSERPVKKAENV